MARIYDDEELQRKADLIDQTPGAGKRGTARGIREGVRPSETLAPINATIPSVSTEPASQQNPPILGVRGAVTPPAPDVVAQAPQPTDPAEKLLQDVNKRGTNAVGAPRIEKPKPTPKPDQKSEAGEFGSVADLTTSPLGAVGATAAVASKGRKFGEGIRNFAGKIKNAMTPSNAANLPYKAGNIAGKVVSRGAPIALGGAAVQAGGTPTSDYEKRFNINPESYSKNDLARFGQEAAVRGVGALTDIGDVVSFGYLGKDFRDKQAATPGLRAPQVNPEQASMDDAETAAPVTPGQTPSYGSGGEPAKFPGVSTVGGATPEVNLAAPTNSEGFRDAMRTYGTPLETLQREAAVRRGGEGNRGGIRNVPILPGAFGSLAALGAAGAAGRVTSAQQRAKTEAEKVALARDVAGASAARADAQLDLQQRQFGETQRTRQTKELDDELEALSAKIAGDPKTTGGYFGTSVGASTEKPEEVKARAGRVKAGLKADLDYTLAANKLGDWQKVPAAKRQSLYLMATIKQRFEQGVQEGDRSLVEYFGTKRFDSRDLTKYLPTDADVTPIPNQGGYVIQLKGGNKVYAKRLAGGGFNWTSANEPVDSDIVALFTPLIDKKEGRR